MASKQSPRRTAVRKVPFVVRAPEAREVSLSGDFTGWAEKLRLSPGPDGEWRTTLQLPPGEYQYRLIVDGEWRDHPEARKRVPNPFGSENCVLTVS